MAKQTAFLLPGIIILALLLAACQPADEFSEEDCPKAEVLCVGLVSEIEGIDASSFNESAWEGVLKAQAEEIAGWVRRVETIDAKDYYQNISSLAEGGYDIVVTVGEQSAQATRTVAENYPGTLFIGVDQEQAGTPSNLAGLTFNNAETSFLAGALAAQITKTGTIAGIFASEMDPADRSYADGFEAGARYINPQVGILSTSHPQGSGSSEAEWGASAAARAIENGADVVFGAGGTVSNGALYETAKHASVYCIGVDIDQWAAYPQAHSCLVSSAVKLITPGVFELIKLAQEGKFPAGNYVGASGLAPYHDFEGSVSKTVKDEISRITADLQAGSISNGLFPDK
jgi:basic membrane protein A